MEVILYPPPERSYIPPNVVVISGEECDDGWCVALRRNGAELVVEGAAPNWRKNVLVDESDPSYRHSCSRAMTLAFAEFLEIIQSLLPYIKFGVANWAYLLKDRKGQHFIRHRERDFYPLSCPVWATLIPEEEIEYTIFATWSERRGIWRNKKVDVHFGRADIGWSKILDMTMHGYKAVQGLDLTYEVYGHLVAKSGAIIGIVTEAAVGRLVRASDKALVYTSISKLQKAGILYRSCDRNQFLIEDNRLRLLEPCAIKRYTDLEQLNQDAETLHWQRLTNLFRDLEIKGELRDANTYPPFRLVTPPWNHQCLLPKISPEHPLKTIEVNLYVSSSRFPYLSILLGEQDCNIIHPGRQGQPDTSDNSEESDSPFLPMPIKRVGMTFPRTQKNSTAVLPYHPYRRTGIARNLAVFVRTASSQTMRTESTSVVLSNGSCDPPSNTISSDEDIPNILSPALLEARRRHGSKLRPQLL